MILPLFVLAVVATSVADASAGSYIKSMSKPCCNKDGSCAPVCPSTRMGLSAAVKDCQINGFEGLNLNCNCPIVVNGMVVGFRYKVDGTLKKAPESLFASKSFPIAGNGLATVNADFDIANKTFAARSKMVFNRLGLTLGANIHSRDRLTHVNAETTQKLGSGLFSVSGSYDFLKKVACGRTRYAVEDTAADLIVNSVLGNSPEVVMSVEHQLNRANQIAAEMSLNTRQMIYKWTRSWQGGNLCSSFHPQESKLTAEWKDIGTSGTWNTKATIPLTNSAETKISFSRDWKY